MMKWQRESSVQKTMQSVLGKQKVLAEEVKGIFLLSCKIRYVQGRNPFHQNFRKFWSKTQWNGSVQPEKFRKNESTIWGGPLFPVGPVGILVQWIAPSYFCPGFSSAHYYYVWLVTLHIHCIYWSLETHLLNLCLNAEVYECFIRP